MDSNFGGGVGEGGAWRATRSPREDGVLPLSRTGQALGGCRQVVYGRGGPGGEGPAAIPADRFRCRSPLCARNERGGAGGGAPLREGCAPAGPRTRSRGAQPYRAPLRRGLGAVGHSCIVPYCARSPTRSAAEGHAHPLRFISCRCCSSTENENARRGRTGHPGGRREWPATGQKTLPPCSPRHTASSSASSRTSAISSTGTGWRCE